MVGGAGKRGVVAAASYEVRAFGVRSAMPMVEALRRCPHAIVVPPRQGRYAEVSAEVFEIFRRYTPLVEGLSVDEAFLDVTASRSLFGSGEEIAQRIRADVRRELGLAASAGVAPNKFAAKVASDLGKPDGLLVVGEDVRAFLDPLPVERMWGIGPKTAPLLRSHGLSTLGDLARARPEMLERLIGSLGRRASELARGEDPRPVEPDREALSIGAECTYEEDLTDPEEIGRTLLAHASRVAERLTTEELLAGSVTVKLKYADFTLLTRQRRLDEPASDTKTLHDACLSLLSRFPLRGARVRLTGVSAHGLVSQSGAQQGLFPDQAQARRRGLERAIVDMRGKFGGAAVTRASLLEPGAAEPAAPRGAQNDMRGPPRSK